MEKMPCSLSIMHNNYLQNKKLNSTENYVMM